MALAPQNDLQYAFAALLYVLSGRDYPFSSTHKLAVEVHMPDFSDAPSSMWDHIRTRRVQRAEKDHLLAKHQVHVFYTLRKPPPLSKCNIKHGALAALAISPQWVTIHHELVALVSFFHGLSSRGFAITVHVKTDTKTHNQYSDAVTRAMQLLNAVGLHTQCDATTHALKRCRARSPSSMMTVDVFPVNRPILVFQCVKPGSNQLMDVSDRASKTVMRLTDYKLSCLVKRKTQPPQPVVFDTSTATALCSIELRRVSQYDWEMTDASAARLLEAMKLEFPTWYANCAHWFTMTPQALKQQQAEAVAAMQAQWKTEQSVVAT